MGPGGDRQENLWAENSLKIGLFFVYFSLNYNSIQIQIEQALFEEAGENLWQFSCQTLITTLHGKFVYVWQR